MGLRRSYAADPPSWCDDRRAVASLAPHVARTASYVLLGARHPLLLTNLVPIDNSNLSIVLLDLYPAERRGAYPCERLRRDACGNPCSGRCRHQHRAASSRWTAPHSRTSRIEFVQATSSERRSFYYLCEYGFGLTAAG